VLARVFGDRRVHRVGPSGPGASPAPDVLAPGFVVECKAAKRTSPGPALRQAVREAKGRIGWPIAVCKDNRREPMVAMRLQDFVALVRDWHELRMRASRGGSQ
jgi:hypothetical protein